MVELDFSACIAWVDRVGKEEVSYAEGQNRGLALRKEEEWRFRSINHLCAFVNHSSRAYGLDFQRTYGHMGGLQGIIVMLPTHL